jgi:hypothetical protein
MVAAMLGHSVPDFIMQLAAPHTSPNCTPLTKQKCTVSTPVNALAASLAGFTPSEQVQQVETMVLQLVASVAGQHQVTRDEPLVEAGWTRCLQSSWPAVAAVWDPPASNIAV